MEDMDSMDYFQSYEDLEIHKLMLSDKPRNLAYKQAITDNAEAIKDKVVLDIGAGTGILSVFCAKAGAKRVYAVEASDTYRIAEETAQENQLSHIIKVLHTKIEDAELPEKVDVIVSEWMGFYLFHEAMLDSVIFARDKFLKEGGLIFPESATLYSAPCSVPKMYEHWDNVDGVSMRYFGRKLREGASSKPTTDLVDGEDVLSDPEIVLWIDLREVQLEEVAKMKVQHVAVIKKPGRYQGICLWFSCTFPSLYREPVTLTTEPGEEPTHWKQTVIVLPSELQVEQGEPVAYELILYKAQENARRYQMELTMLDPSEIEHPEFCQCQHAKCVLVRAMLERYEQENQDQNQMDS